VCILKDHLIVVNFKAYSEVCGNKGLDLAKVCESVSDEAGVQIVACPQLVDLAETANSVHSPVWSQTVDAVPPGGRTGHATAEAIAAAGALGTLINHSECRKKIFDIEDAITRCRKNKLVTCVCTNNIAVSKAAASLGPTYVAVEPPELIGGDISVTTSDPQIVSNTVDLVKAIDRDVEVLCGAGVKDAKDVSKAIELGAKGVLLASGVVKAKNPEEVLRDLASAV